MAFILTLNAADVQGLGDPNNLALHRHPHLRAGTSTLTKRIYKFVAKNGIQNDGSNVHAATPSQIWERHQTEESVES